MAQAAVPAGAHVTAPSASAAGGPLTVLRFQVPGEPIGKERPRFVQRTKTDGSTFGAAVTPKRTREYEKHIQMMAQIAVNQSRWAWSRDDRFAVIVKVYRTHVDRGPDVDNVCKALLDACNGVTWNDDRHVWAFAVALRKRDPKNPRLDVEIRRFHKDRG